MRIACYVEKIMGMGKIVLDTNRSYNVYRQGSLL